MNIYKDYEYCPYCDADTLQNITDSQHERDSSSDSKECLKCGSTYLGYSDEWEDKEGNTINY